MWAIRELLSRQVLLARPLLSSAAPELARLLREAASDLAVPIVGVVSDGQESIRLAVADALPGVPHQLKNTAAAEAESVKARDTALMDRVREQAGQAGSLQEAMADLQLRLVQPNLPP